MKQSLIPAMITMRDDLKAKIYKIMDDRMMLAGGFEKYPDKVHARSDNGESNDWDILRIEVYVDKGIVIHTTDKTAFMLEQLEFLDQIKVLEFIVDYWER